MAKPERFVMQQLTLRQAQKQFPGSVDDEVRDINKTNRLEKNYFRLVTYQGKLYSCTYEIAWMGWSVWNGKEWQDLDHADGALFERFTEADGFTFKPPVKAKPKR